MFDHGYPADTPGVTCTIEQLRELCVEWQKVLRLQDWDINLTISRRRDIGDRNLGWCETLRPTKYARIKVLDAADYDFDGDREGDIYVPDMEHTLVHELLHVQFDAVFATVDLDDTAHTGFEQAIDLTAWALIKLKRSKTSEVA